MSCTGSASCTELWQPGQSEFGSCCLLYFFLQPTNIFAVLNHTIVHPPPKFIYSLITCASFLLVPRRISNDHADFLPRQLEA